MAKIDSMTCIDCGHPMGQHEGNLKLAKLLPKAKRGTKPRGGSIRCGVIVKGKPCPCHL